MSFTDKITIKGSNKDTEIFLKLSIPDIKGNGSVEMRDNVLIVKAGKEVIWIPMSGVKYMREVFK